MSAEQIKVRPKKLPETGRSKYRSAMVFGFVLFLISVVVFAVFAYSANFDYQNAPNEIIQETNRQIIRVPAGGNLQEAVNRAQSGDIIELQAGAVYNAITLPKKNSTDFITIQSSQINQLAENVRVAPPQAGLMAKIVTRSGSKGAVEIESGAHHYRFVGIEFFPQTADYVYNLIYFGTDSSRPADVPHDLEIDRSYIHSTDKGRTRRGLALNSASTVVKNSYFEGFAFPQEETQGICGWTGTRNVKVFNNYIEGGAENLMFGGSDPANAELIPQDIEVRGNYFTKPAAWKDKNTIKCLFELKNAKRVQFVGNYLKNNWVGSAFRVTVRNDGGQAAFSTLEDIIIKDNFIDGAGEGINILGKDDIYPSQTMKNLTISNNLFLNIGAEGFEGSGAFIKVSGGENIRIVNNTAFNQGNIATFHGETPVNFLFRDNITNFGNYGIHGLGDARAIGVQKMFQNNLFINASRIPANEFIFPSNNFSVQNISDVGFAAAARNDFRLLSSSRFKAKGADGVDLGSSLNSDSIPK